MSDGVPAQACWNCGELQVGPRRLLEQTVEYGSYEYDCLYWGWNCGKCHSDVRDGSAKIFMVKGGLFGSEEKVEDSDDPDIV